MFVVGDRVRVLKKAPGTGSCEDQIGLCGTVTSIDEDAEIEEVFVQLDTPVFWGGVKMTEFFYYEHQLELLEPEDYEVCLV